MAWSGVVVQRGKRDSEARESLLSSVRAVDDEEEEDDDAALESPRTRDTEVQSHLRGGGRSEADDETEESPMGAHHDGCVLNPPAGVHVCQRVCPCALRGVDVGWWAGPSCHCFSLWGS
jgi:hypothetical protein